ncbi:MAG: DUF3048 domain-containing protein, partial [Firmicutes bacterium]|nr:DUF3048 domain-containing protein [Bacillota bacterium]
AACGGDEQGNGDTPPAPQPVQHPLTGETVDELLPRAYLVSLGNTEAAQPQHGLTEADIIYEIPVESGISRLFALYYGELPEVIGPVRSVRDYIVDLAREWDAVLVHCGWSEAARLYLSSELVDYVNELTNGQQYFWRSADRKAPHNLYTSGENMAQMLVDKGFDAKESDVPAYRFMDKGEKYRGNYVNALHIYYGISQAGFLYDEESDSYLRFTKTDAHVDAATDEQLTAKAVIVQYVHTAVVDDEGRLAMSLAGEGEAQLFVNGIIREGYWQRDSLDEHTYFYDDETKQTWALPGGQLWIEIADGSTVVVYDEVEAESK